MKYIIKTIRYEEKFGYMLPLEEEEITFDEMAELVNYREKWFDEVHSHKILLRHMDSEKMVFIVDKNEIKAYTEDSIYND